jgi:TonB dependent receptor/Carboxypeptidase regulatory-like domain
MKKRYRNRGNVNLQLAGAGPASGKSTPRSFHCGNHLIHAFVVGALASVTIPNVSWSQTSESTLRGQAPANATVTARNLATGAVRRTTAGEDGAYVLVGLPAGTYRVDAGGASQDITLAVASTETYDLDQQIEEVQVVGTRIQEMRTSEVGAYVSDREIETIPQVTRNFLEFADTVPGMQFNIDSNGNATLRGGSQLDERINVYIDGVSQKDYITTGGGITGQSGASQTGDPGNPFPQLAIDQYKVVTSNYTAEYGQASSAIIVAQTKSGTNEFQGEAFGDYTNQNMRAETPAEAASTTGKARAHSDEYGLAESGPIIKDVLHFFVTWEHKSLAEQNVVYPGANVSEASLVGILPANVLSQFGPTTNPFKEDLLFGKLDFEPTSADRFELSGKLREETQIAGAQAQTAASASQNYKNDDNRWQLLWQHSADRWVNEALVTFQNTDSSTATTNANPQINYGWFPNVSGPNANTSTGNLIAVGGPGSGNGSQYVQSGFGLQDDFSLPNLQWMGDHTVKFGGRFQALSLTAENSSSSPYEATYYYAVTPAGTAATPYELQYPNLTQGFNSSAITTKDKQFGVYFQDDWQVNRHLLVNAGLRWDYEVVPAFENFKTPTNVVDAINGDFPGLTQTYASVLAEGSPNVPGININDYISTGSNRKPQADEFQPRLGFSYDINEDQRYVVFGGYGRSYDRNLYSTLSLETTKIALNSNPQIYFPSAQTNDPFAGIEGCFTNADVNPTNHCYAWNPAYLTAAGLAGFQTNPSSHEVDMINNNIKAPYSDQFSVGFRTRMGDWNLGATLSDIRSYDTILGHWGGRYANGAIYQNGNQWGGQGVPGVGSLILWDNGGGDEDLQLGISATKPYTMESGWSATIAYTYSDAFQNNVSGDQSGYAANYNQYLFDLPYPKDYPMLPSNAVAKHRIVGTYSHDLPWNLVIAGKLTLATPIPVDNTYGCPGVCNIYGGSTHEVSNIPSETLGYRDFDFQMTKNFVIPHVIAPYLRFDILNVFNYYNFDPTADIWNETSVRPTFNGTGPIVGVPRTFKLSAGLKW